MGRSTVTDVSRAPQPWMPWMAQVVRELFFTKRGDPRSGRASLAWLLIPALAVILLYGRAFFTSSIFPDDPQATLSLDQAVNAHYCGKPGGVASAYSVGELLAADRRLITHRISDILTFQSGSVEAYCRSVDGGRAVRETSLTMLMRLALRPQRNATVRRIGKVLGGVRLMLLLVVGYAMLASGASVALATVAVLVLAQLAADLIAVQYSPYAFIAPLLACVPALYLIAVRQVVPRHPAWLLLFSVAAGIVASFCAGLFGDPAIQILLFVAFLWAAWRCASPARAVTATIAAAACVCFAAGYVTFAVVAFRPFTSVPQTASSSLGSAVVRPLVFGLAIPENPLSRGEGIAWNDEAGLTLAHRVVPEASFPGRSYEGGLLLYYVRLWMTRGSTMRHVYHDKFAIAGIGMFSRSGDLARDPFVTVIDGTVPVTAGYQLLALYGIVLLAAVIRVYLGHRFAVLTLLFSVIAVLMFLQSALVISVFEVRQHGFLLFYTCFLVALTMQFLIDRVGRAWRRG
jgi:hypothetical protein